MVKIDTTEDNKITPEAESQESVQSQPPSSPKKNPRLPFVIIILVLLVISFGAIGFLAYQNYQLKQKGMPQEGTDIPSLSPTVVLSEEPTVISSPIPTVDPKAGWSVFSSKNTCYTFKYPSNINRSEEGGVHLSLWGPTQEKDTEFYDGISLNFSLPLALGNKTLIEYIDTKIEDAKVIGEVVKPRQEMTINGINGYTYTEQGLGIFQNIYLQSTDKKCIVAITNATSDATNQGYQKTVDQILSTFEFK